MERRRIRIISDDSNMHKLILPIVNNRNEEFQSETASIPTQFIRQTKKYIRGNFSFVPKTATRKTFQIPENFLPLGTIYLGSEVMTNLEIIRLQPKTRIANEMIKFFSAALPSNLLPFFEMSK